MSGDTKHWFEGLPVPQITATGTGAVKYWINGKPVPIIDAGSPPPPSGTTKVWAFVIG